MTPLCMALWLWWVVVGFRPLVLVDVGLGLPGAGRGGRRRLGPGFREATLVARGCSGREQRTRFRKAGSIERGGSSSALPSWRLRAHMRMRLWDVAASPFGLGWGSLRRERHFRLVFLLRAIAISGPLCHTVHTQRRPAPSWRHVHVRIRASGDAGCGM